MRGIVKSLSLLSVLGILLLFPASLLAENDDVRGVISGILTNGTTGECVPAVEVTLQSYEGDEKGEKVTTISDSEGRFSFLNLDRRKGQSYVLQTVYKDVEYYSPLIVFTDQAREISHDVTVYDTTDSDREISIVMHHLLAEPKDGALWVREMIIVENRNNKVFVGRREIGPDKKETLRISLPPQALGLQLLRGLMACCVVETQDGFADTMDIKPGRKEISFAYKIDSGSSSVNLSKRINLTTDSLSFFIPNRGIRAKGENIQYAGLIGESGKGFLHFTARNLANGSQLVLNLKGLPWGRKLFKRIALILGLALMGFGLVYPLVRWRRKPSETKREIPQQSGEKSTLQDERERILWAIAKLDDQLDSGQISRQEHDRKRHLLKEEVITITETLRNTEKS